MRATPFVLAFSEIEPRFPAIAEALQQDGAAVTDRDRFVLLEPVGRLLKEIVPGLSRVAVFWNPLNPAYGPILKELEAAAQPLGMELQRLEVRVPEDFAGAFQAARKQRAGALIAPGDPLVTNRPRMVADLALKHRLPTMMENKEMAAAGGLLSLGPDIVDSYRRSATLVDKILNGAKPGDLPMEQPTKFDLVVNLTTARALGLTIPQSVLAQTTQVIQ